MKNPRPSLRLGWREASFASKQPTSPLSREQRTSRHTHPELKARETKVVPRGCEVRNVSSPLKGKPVLYVIISSVQRATPLSEGKEMFEKTYRRPWGRKRSTPPPPPPAGDSEALPFGGCLRSWAGKSSPQNKVKLVYVSSVIMSDRIIFQ